MRISQNTVFLSQLMNEVETGNLVPAGMQRPYVWEKNDVEDLCRSIQDGFPIGSIFTWRPDGMSKEYVTKPRLGPISPDAKNRYFRAILDGQNRLATIAWMTGEKTDDGLSEAEDRVWNSGEELVLDANKGALIFVPSEEAQDGLRLPAASLFGEGMRIVRDYWKIWEAAGISEDEANAFLNLHDDISHAFRTASLVETCVSEASLPEVKDAFLRICRTGVPISDEDITNALKWMTDQKILAD